MMSQWLETEFSPNTILHLAIDRTKWGCINLFVVSLIWNKRGYPIYWSLLEKQGNSSYADQTTILSLVLPLFKQYKVIVLGDREFCSVKLGNWLQARRVYFCLRLRQNEYALGKRAVATTPRVGTYTGH